MKAPESGEGTFRHLSTIGLILAIVAGYIIAPTEAPGTRHSEPTRIQRNMSADEQIPARLWQDPLQALHRYVQERQLSDPWATDALTSIPTLKPEGLDLEFILPRLEPTLGSDVEVGTERGRAPAMVLLGVMLDGSTTAEAAEQRRRRRQAVISALAAQGYIPEAPEHIGLFEDGLAEKSQTLFVSYEWMMRDPILRSVDGTPEDARPSWALVLWLDETWFGSPVRTAGSGRQPRDVASDGPLDRVMGTYGALLQGVARHLEQSGRDVRAEVPSRITLRLIGPSSSGSLIPMMQELTDWDAVVARQEPPPSVPPAVEHFLEATSEYLDNGLPHPPSQDSVVALAEAIEAFRGRYEQLYEDVVEDHGTEVAAVVELTVDEVVHERGPWDEDPSSSEIRQALRANVNELADDSVSKKDVTDLVSRIAALGGRSTPTRVALARTLYEAFPGVVDSVSDWHTGAVSRWESEEAPAEGSWRPEAPGPIHIEDVLGRHLKILSPRATLSRPLAGKHPGIRGWLDVDQARRVRDLFSQPGHPEVHSTVADDHQLALALVDELGRRGIEPYDEDGRPHDQIVLLSEWDSLYGRSLPLVVEAAGRYRAEHPAADQEGTLPRERAEAWDQTLLTHVSWDVSAGPGPSDPTTRSGPFHRVSYLRGLDGVLPGVPDAAVPSSRSDTPKSGTGKPEASGDTSASGAADQVGSLLGVLRDLQESPGLAEHAVGRNQKDQLIRIGENLELLDRRLQLEGRGPIRAIGVLGSDIYDKQMILGVLRERFPRVQFFTTDADARYLHRDHYKNGRNLIIASSFGLRLADEIQGDTPPFRDGYQTSTFLACRLALAPADQFDEHWREVEGALTRPRIFEVGGNGLVDLSMETPSRGLHPPAVRVKPLEGKLGRCAILLGLVAALGFTLNRGLREHVKASWKTVVGYTLLSVAAYGVLLIVIRRDVSSMGGEPFRLFDGVSLWPTEFIRLTSALVSLLFFVLARNSIANNQDHLTRRYGFRVLRVPRRESGSRGWWRRWRDPAGALSRAMTWRRRVSISRWAAEIEGSDVADAPLPGPERIWVRYRQLGRMKSRLARVLPLGLLYWITGMALMWTLGFPRIPYRGEIAFWTDKVVLTLSVLLIILLMFFVIDASRLCAQLIRALGRTRGPWPEASEGRESETPSGRPRELAAEHMAMEFISRHSIVVGQLIIYPFIVLLLMMLARHSVFDAWDLPLSLAIIFLTMATLAIAAATVLRQAAVRARGRLLDRMHARLYGLQHPTDEEQRRRFELMIKDTVRIREGALSPWTQNPVLQAVLIPAGGYSLISLIETLAAGS